MMLRRLVSLLLVCTLALWDIPSGVAVADGLFPAGYDRAVKVLQQFHLVAGDAGGLRPFDSLTRAEVAKLAVVGMAMGDQASYYEGGTAFSDVQNHWAQGYINLAKQVGLMKGYPDGSFRPDSPVTYAEVVALMARVAGLGPTGNDWPDNWIRSAQDANILVPGMEHAPTETARRGDVFVLLYRSLTEVKDFSGLSLLQRRFKFTPPIIAVDALETVTKDLYVTVSGSVDAAEVVTVNGKDTALDNNRFTARVSLELGLNKIDVVAIDVAGNRNVSQQQLVRENTDAARIEIAGPHQIGAGQMAHLDVVVKDTNGAVIGNLVNMMATVPPVLGTFDAYSGTFYAAQKPVKGELVLTFGSARAVWPITVGTGGLVTLKITPENALVKRGQEQTFSLAGTDEFGNSIDVSSMSPTWRADGGVINAGGVYAATSNGTGTVTALVGDQTVSTKVTVYGSPAKIALKSPDHLTANNYDTVSVPVEVQDADGNLVPDYTGTLTVSSTATSVANTTVSTVGVTGGRASITVKAGTQPGSAQLIASETKLASGLAVVTVDAQRFATIGLTTDPTTLSADGASLQILSVTAIDSKGKPMLSPLNPPLTVHLVSSSASALAFESTGSGTIDIGLGAIDGASGTATTKVILKSGTTEGAVSIAGLVSGPRDFAGVPVRTLPLRTAKVGTAAKLSFDPVQSSPAGTTVPLYLRILDANGNQLSSTTDLQTVNITLKDQTGKIYSPSVGVLAGKGRAEFDLLLYKATTYTFTATATSASTGTMQPASQSLVITPGAANGLVLSGQPTLVKADGGVSHATITATVQDAYGNVVPTGAYSVAFSRTQANGATGTLPPLLQNTAQGVARLIVPSGSGIGSDTFSASTNGLTTRNGVVVTSAIMGVPTRLAMRYGDNNGDGLVNATGDNMASVGSTITVYVDLLDNQTPGYVTTSENGQIVSLMVKNLTTGDQQTYSSSIQYGTATFTFTKSQATTYSLRATLGGFTPVGTIGLAGTLSDLVFSSGQGTALVVTPDINLIRANPGKSYSTLTVSLVDGVGNPTINTNAVPVSITLKASSTTYGHFTSDNGANGTVQDSYTAVIQPNTAASNPVNWYSTAQFGSATIAASATGYATGTTVVTSRLVGSPTALQMPTPVDSPAQPYTQDHNSIVGQVVKLVVVDSQGFQVTDYGSTNEQLNLTTGAGSVIVAYYDNAAGVWMSLDQTPGGATATYPTTSQITAYKGQAVFRVRAGLSGTYTYTGAIPAAGSQLAVNQSVTGKFGPGPLSRLRIVAAPAYTVNGATVNPVAGGGSTTLVTAEFVDQYGNVITDQVGTVYFQWNNSQLGSLLSTNAIAQNGQASAVFQTTSNLPLPNGTLQVTAYTSVTQPGGAPLTSGSQSSPASITLTVDSNAPAVQNALIAPGGGTVGVVTSGDSMSITFSEAVKGSLIASGLGPSSFLSGPSVGNMRVFFNRGAGGTDTITFGGGLTLGTISLQSDNMDLNGAATVAYAVSSLNMDASGTQITVVLGGPLSGAASVPLTLSANPAMSTYTPPTNLTDLAGNAIGQTPWQLNIGSGF